MTKFLFSNLIIAAVGIWSANCFSAFAGQENRLDYGFGKNHKVSSSLTNFSKVANEGQMSKSATNMFFHADDVSGNAGHIKNAQDKDVVVEIVLNYDNALYSPSMGSLMSEDIAEPLYPTEGYPFSTEIPAGTYSLVYAFDKYDSNGLYIGVAYVILEHLSIESDSCFEINPNDATRHMKFAPLAPDGEPIHLVNKDIFASDEGHRDVIKNPGNIDFLMWQFEPMHKYVKNGISTIHKADYEGDLYLDNAYEKSYACPSDIWISNVSDEWVPLMTMIFGAEGKLNIAMFSIDGESTGTISNSIDSYHEIEYPNIQQSYFGATCDMQPKEDYIKVDMLSEYEDKGYSPIDGISINNFMKRYAKDYSGVRIAETPLEKHRERINSRIDFNKFDAVVKFSVDTFPDGIDTTEVLSSNSLPPFYLSNGRKTPVYHMEETYYHYIWDNRFDMLNCCSHPWLPSVDRMSDITYGSTLHYVSSFMSGMYNKYNDGMGMDMRTLDYFGASNSTILGKGEWSVDYNGENIDINKSDYDLPTDWAFFRYNIENHPAGKYTLHFTTPLEIVDGLEGHTYFTAEFDQRKTDCTAPAIQFMTMANPKGEHTNIFDTPDDAIIRITGGDFDWNTETNLPAPVPCEMVVELSPYSLGLWERVEMKPADIDLPPHFAESFEGVPANISNTSESGWYDLRISMTDTSGNYMTQTISPAFKVNSLKTGVSSVVRESSVKVMNNNIIVPEGAVIYTSSGIPTDGNNVSEGIYIVLYNGNSSKVVVK